MDAVERKLLVAIRHLDQREDVRHRRLFENRRDRRQRCLVAAQEQPLGVVAGHEVHTRAAVKEDRVVYLDLTDRMAGALGFASALSLPYLLDEADAALTAAVDGGRRSASRAERLYRAVAER